MGSEYSDFYFQEYVPQGSVLSYTLFPLKINSVLKQLPSSVYGYLYVDDLTIFCQDSVISFIEKLLQLAVNRIRNWTLDNGFT